MKNFVLIFILFFSSMSFGNYKNCFEKVGCFAYYSGVSRFSIASSEKHAASLAIPDVIYIRVVGYDANGNRFVTSGQNEVWYKTIRSNYSMASTEAHLKSMKTNYEQAKNLCQQAVENYKFEMMECR